MMRLATMEMLVRTLDERGTSPIANAIAVRWDHDPGSVRFFRASANFLFTFKHAGREYVLRFINAKTRTVDALCAELAFINHLASRGIQVAKPVRSVAGKFVERIVTEQGLFHAVVFERLTGKPLELEELTPATITRWGEALGELHVAAEGYREGGRPTWQDHIAFVAADLPAEETAAKAMLNQIQEQFAQLAVTSHNFGLIHFDFEPDNLIRKDTHIGIVDFDDCAYYWFAADVAFALRDLFGDSPRKVNLQNETVRHFIHGYRRAKAIDDAEVEHIPLFLTLHNLFTLVRLYHSIGANEPTGEPVWVAELRKKLCAKIAFYRDEFARSLA
jgi:Ser/Thr protein kinase RdoA (MazF antagonist)